MGPAPSEPVQSTKKETTPRKGAKAWEPESSSEDENVEACCAAAVVLQEASPEKRSRLSEASGVGAQVGPFDSQAMTPVVKIPVEPMILLGVEAWLKPLLSMTESVRAKAGFALRHFLTENFHFGSGAELCSLKLLGIPHQCIGIADKTQSGRDVLQRLFSENVSCCFTTGQELLTGVGFDRLHCRDVRLPAESRPDMSTTRLPPYAPPRKNSAVGEGDAATSYDMVASEFLEHLRIHRPVSFLLNATSRRRRHTRRPVGTCWPSSRIGAKNMVIARSTLASPTPCGYKAFPGRVD